MKKILCPTDFSNAANSGITYAAKLAQKLGAVLTLFNVHSLAEFALEEVIVGEEDTALTQSRLDQLCNEVHIAFKISCAAEVITSIAGVSEFISSTGMNHDLIVMGSNGPSNLAQFIFGSNTYQVIRKSLTPVMLIPEGCGYSEIGTIVYAFDYWRNDRLPMTQLVRLTKALGSDLRVLQIMEESYSRIAEKEVLGMQEIFLDRYKDDIPISFDTIYAADSSDSLDNYVLRNNADLLALCTEDHGFLRKLFHKSLVKKLTERATYPLFVFHA